MCDCGAMCVCALYMCHLMFGGRVDFEKVEVPGKCKEHEIMYVVFSLWVMIQYMCGSYFIGSTVFEHN